MRVIGRPETTTIAAEFYFHVIKDEKEAKNIMEGHTEDDLFVVAKKVDEITFQPTLYFAIRENKPFITWKKYVASIELLHNSNIEVKV